uniref:Uncharacterized protein n=1 Tax=Poecilia reticulata TaxID=8081 RepID=A0A3P9NZ04_POERE
MAAVPPVKHGGRSGTWPGCASPSRPRAGSPSWGSTDRNQTDRNQVGFRRIGTRSGSGPCLNRVPIPEINPLQSEQIRTQESSDLTRICQNPTELSDRSGRVVSQTVWVQTVRPGSWPHLPPSAWNTTDSLPVLMQPLMFSRTPLFTILYMNYYYYLFIFIISESILIFWLCFIRKLIFFPHLWL